MIQLSFDFDRYIPRVCKGCGLKGKFKRPICSTCHWEDHAGRRALRNERAKARYAARKASRLAREAAAKEALK